MKINNIIIVGLISILASCKKEKVESNVNPIISTQIYPLKIGNRWDWRKISYGTPNDTTYKPISITGDTLIGLDHWYLEQEYPLPPTLIANRSDGFYIYCSSANMGKLYLKYPAQLNDSYSQDCYNDSIFVLSIDTTITVAAGTFNCYHYLVHGIGSPDESHVYASPGIGTIKSQHYFSNFLAYEFELMSYSLN